MRSTILAILALSAAAIVACGDSNPPAKDPTTTPPSDSSDAGGGGSSGSAGSSGGSTTAAADAGGSTAAASSGAMPPADHGGFDALSMDKKTEVMMTKVVPNVGKEFKTFDGKKFEKFGCKTCHGDAKTKSKDDPKKVLPKLTLSGGGFEKLQKSKPAMVKFMSEKVVPTMADSLGEKPFDPATKSGFGCGGCHAVD